MLAKALLPSQRNLRCIPPTINAEHIHEPHIAAEVTQQQPHHEANNEGVTVENRSACRQLCVVREPLGLHCILRTRRFMKSALVVVEKAEPRGYSKDSLPQRDQRQMHWAPKQVLTFLCSLFALAQIQNSGLSTHTQHAHPRTLTPTIL